MFCIWILEDNPVQSKMIKEYVLEYEHKRQERAQKCLASEIKIVNEHFRQEMGRMTNNAYGQNQIFVIDIDLKSEDSGVEVARKLRLKLPFCHIVFLSSHIELMSQVFLHNLKVLTFIDKGAPLLKERLFSAFDAVLEETRHKETIKEKKSVSPTQSFCYQYKGNFYRIAFDRIMGIETSTEKRGIEIITKDKTYPSRLSMKKIKEMLPSNFVYAHRAVIVNTNFVQEIINNKSTFIVVMDGGYTFPASQHYITQLIKNLHQNEG